MSSEGLWPRRAMGPVEAGKRLTTVHAETRTQLREHLEVVALGPDGETMHERGRGDDGVHGMCPPPPIPCLGEQLGESLRHRLVIGNRYEASGARQGRLADRSQRPGVSSAHSDDQLGEGGDGDPRILGRRRTQRSRCSTATKTLVSAR